MYTNYTHSLVPRAHNFTGFRDMPYNPRMTRKPSTCSLPAALLTENRVTTPSSSVDGLSPTDSTCSLDKAALIVSQTSGSMTDMFYTLNGAQSPASYDVAVLKAMTAGQGGTGKDGTLKSSVVSPPLSVTSPSSPPILSPPATSDVESDVSRGPYSGVGGTPPRPRGTPLQYSVSPHNKTGSSYSDQQTTLG